MENGAGGETEIKMGTYGETKNKIMRKRKSEEESVKDIDGEKGGWQSERARRKAVGKREGRSYMGDGDFPGGFCVTPSCISASDSTRSQRQESFGDSVG